MVLNPSDYQVPQFGRFNPLSLRTYAKIAGLIVAATAVIWSLLVARNQGVPIMDQLVSNVPVVGSRLQAGGSSPRRFGR